MARKNVVVSRVSIRQCQACRKNFYRESDYKRHLIMIKKWGSVENKQKHSKLI